jgi:hypothetical protein
MSNYDLLKQINPKNGTSVLDIDMNFPSFPVFFDNSKQFIYKKMIDVFNELHDQKIKSKTLVVNARINGITFSTEFNINVEIPYMITEIIIPFFESIEDYEFCYTAMTTYEMLINDLD